MNAIVGDRGIVKYSIPSPNQLMYPIQWMRAFMVHAKKSLKRFGAKINLILLVDNKWLLMEPFINAELSNAILFHLALHLAVYSHDF